VPIRQIPASASTVAIPVVLSPNILPSIISTIPIEHKRIPNAKEAYCRGMMTSPPCCLT
jgi:hypothetical protein